MDDSTRDTLETEPNNIVIMRGAIGMVHGKVGFFMNWAGQQGGEGFEYHLLAIAALLPIVIAGSGRYALARVLAWPKTPGMRTVAHPRA